MDDLKQHLNKIEALPPRDLWDDIEDRASGGGDDLSLDGEASPPAGRRIRAGIAAVLVFFIAASFAWVGLRHLNQKVPISTSPPVPEHLQAHVADQIDVGPFPQVIAVGEGGVWVDVPSQAQGTPPEIVRIDPTSDRVVARIPVPEGESDIAAGEGSVWVTRDTRRGGQLVLQTLRIDPATDTIVATLPDVGGQVAIGEGYVWALSAGSGDTTSILVKIDPQTGSVIARLPLGATVSDIVIGGGFVWLSTLALPSMTLQSPALIQVDPLTMQALRIVRHHFSDSPVFAVGMLWVPVPLCCTNNVTLVRVNPATGETVGETIDVGDGLPFADAFGHLLLMSERGTLSDLNPASGVVEVLVKSDWPAAHGTTVFDPVSGSVWVSNYRRTVTRIDVRDATSAQVPDVIGMDGGKAIAILRHAGFGAQLSYRNVKGGGWRVTEVLPAVGYRVPVPGTRLRVVIATHITPLPAGAAEALDCPPDGWAVFGGPRLVLSPSGSAHIAANLIGRITKQVQVVQVTVEGPDGDGLWHVIRSGSIVAVVDYRTLDGVACQGSGVAGI